MPFALVSFYQRFFWSLSHFQPSFKLFFNHVSALQPSLCSPLLHWIHYQIALQNFSVDCWFCWIMLSDPDHLIDPNYASPCGLFAFGYHFATIIKYVREIRALSSPYSFSSVGSTHERKVCIYLPFKRTKTPSSVRGRLSLTLAITAIYCKKDKLRNSVNKNIFYHLY